MSTGWPHDQVAPPGPDDEDSWPPAGGGRAASAERPAADQQPGDEPPGDQPSRGRSAGKPSRRERRGQADGRDRGARDGDEDYEWIQFLTGGRPSAPDPADPPQQSSGAAALSPGASRDRAPYGADARAAGAPPGESRPS